MSEANIEANKKGKTCPNSSCSKVFTAPLRAVNLQQDASEPYDACPFCLTKLAESSTAKIGPEEEPVTIKTALPSQKQFESKQKPPECHHYLGYLGDRQNRDQFPDECMVCKDIVDCMLKKMNRYC